MQEITLQEITWENLQSKIEEFTVYKGYLDHYLDTTFDPYSPETSWP